MQVWRECKIEKGAEMRGEEHFKRGKKTNGNQPSDLSNKALKTSFALFITDGFACFATKVHCLKMTKNISFFQNILC